MAEGLTPAACADFKAHKPSKTALQQENGMFTAATCRLRLVYLLKLIPPEPENDSDLIRAKCCHEGTPQITQKHCSGLLGMFIVKLL